MSELKLRPQNLFTQFVSEVKRRPHLLASGEARFASHYCAGAEAPTSKTNFMQFVSKLNKAPTPMDSSECNTRDEGAKTRWEVEMGELFHLETNYEYLKEKEISGDAQVVLANAVRRKEKTRIGLGCALKISGSVRFQCARAECK